MPIWLGIAMDAPLIMEELFPAVEITHHFWPGRYAKEMRMRKGFRARTHRHKTAHWSVLEKGRARVEVDGVEEIYDAPAAIKIVAGKAHRITALRPVVWFCIWETDETDPDTIDEMLIEDPSDALG